MLGDECLVKILEAQQVSSLHLSKGCLNPPSRSDTYSSSAEGVAMDWKTMLSYISGSLLGLLQGVENLSVEQCVP